MSPRMSKLLPWISTAAALVRDGRHLEARDRGLRRLAVRAAPARGRPRAASRDLVQSNDFWSDVRVTLTETLVGFAIALVLGIGLGTLLGRVAWLEQACAR